MGLTYIKKECADIPKFIEKRFIMEKMKKIMAWVGIIVLLSLYLVTFLLGIFGSPATKDLLMASLACTVIVPCLMYAMLLIARVLGGKKDDLSSNK